MNNKAYEEMLVEDKYKEEYTEKKLVDKIKKNFSKAGASVVYAVLLLFYSLKDPNVPAKAKVTIVGALGYFITPLDLILDAVPVAGYSDDLATIMLALGVVAIYLTDETKEKAKKKTKQLFGNIGNDEFEKVDNKINYNKN
ncbi:MULTISPECIES: YkvA family protein [unclassified Clostridium]|uniref:YkvA family protein n=1 Tax=unclassified Clostridium TaxID=2614128 RepID=UPI0025C5827E|nr:DUF1232 domain-containing protein [Clostridium sp.]MDY4253718.1 DUF1232 domain-containing protein [Clostridium sp.]